MTTTGRKYTSTENFIPAGGSAPPTAGVDGYQSSEGVF